MAGVLGEPGELAGADVHLVDVEELLLPVVDLDDDLALVQRAAVQLVCRGTV